MTVNELKMELKAINSKLDTVNELKSELQSAKEKMNAVMIWTVSSVVLHLFFLAVLFQIFNCPGIRIITTGGGNGSIFTERR